MRRGEGEKEKRERGEDNRD
jgi:hypothetical protein